MAKVGFFTAVSFGNQPKSCSQWLLEKVDSCLYLGGKKAIVIPGHAQQGFEGTILKKASQPFLITALKVSLYVILPIIPLCLLIAKAILRSIHRFHIIGIDIPPATIAKIRALASKIRGGIEDEELTWYPSNNPVFSLTSAPHLIFKTVHPHVRVLVGRRFLSAAQIAEERLANMAKARRICLIHKLSLLIIPHAMKFEVEGMTFIAEERINIIQNESAQEHAYQLSGLNETVRQLATFIAKTGFSGVAWRKMPIVDIASEFQGNRRVALVDLKEMESASVGLFGRIAGEEGHYRQGLINCLSSEEQIDIVLDVAKKHGIVKQDAEEIKARRLEEIRNDQQLQQFYARNGMLENPRKPIEVSDLRSLGLELEEEALACTGKKIKTGEEGSYVWEKEIITMRKAITDVISAINKEILKTPEEASLKGKRYIQLDHDSQERENLFLKEYHRLGCQKGQPVDNDERWLKRIIDALVAKGHLFKLDKIDNYGYFLQA